MTKSNLWLMLLALSMLTGVILFSLRHGTWDGLIAALMLTVTASCAAEWSYQDESEYQLDD